MRTVLATLVLAAVVFASGGDAAAPEVKTGYFLSKSIVTLTATVTTKSTFPADPRQGMTPAGSVETSQVVVTLSSVADPDMPLILSSDAALLAKNTITVELTGAGLLASVNLKSEGALGGIVKNIFGAVVSLTKAAAGLRMSTATSPEQKYEVDQAEPAKRRNDLKTAIRTTTTSIFETEKMAIAAKTPEERKALKSRVADLQDSLENLRAHLLLADAHFAAWKARMEDAKDQRVEHAVDVDDLPDDTGIVELASSADPNILLDAVVAAACTFDGLVKKGCAFGEIVKQTRVVITQSSKIPDVKSETAKPGDASSGVFYRAVRPATIAVYLLNGNNKPVLSKRSVEFVTGRRSPLMSLALSNSKWSTKSLGATFTGGALTKITSELGSELAGAAETLRGIPTEYLAAIKQAGEIVTERNKLDAAGVQAQIDELKKQKELTETRIATGESADLAAMQAQTARLDAELKLLTSRRALAGSQTVGDQATLALQVQMIKLQNDLVEAQVKQLQLQQQLEELRKKVGGV